MNFISKKTGVETKVNAIPFPVILGIVLGSSAALAGPQGGQVSSGSASISHQGKTTTIDQSTPRAVINWDGFSINAGEMARFNQPGSESAVLNRVTGVDASAIYGTLTSNGRVFLLNPNGILVGPDGVIDAGAGFVGSTLNVPDSAFMSGGDLNFAGEAMSGVVNYGSIRAADGDVALIGYTVENHGAIDVRQGRALLGAGHNVILKASGDNRLYIRSTIGAEGAATGTGVDQKGVINSASAELKAAGGNVYALAVNNAGVINATGISTIDGRVVLTSDDGDVQVSGTVTAKRANGDGGEVLVGGEYRGGKPGEIANARSVLVTEDTVLDVSAGSATGNGGRAIVWADNTTGFHGFIDGRAGGEAGDGGFAEVSGKRHLVFQGLADLSAVNGDVGTLLLDPSDIEITDDDPEENTDFDTDASPAVLGSDGNSPTVINASTVSDQLEMSDVSISTDSGGSDDGDITVNSPIAWSSGNSLQFDAVGNIAINADVTNTGGADIFLYDRDGSDRPGGSVTSAAGATLAAGEINVAADGDVNLAGPVDTDVFTVATLGIGGSLTVDNNDNNIGDLAFESDAQMSGDVNVFDSGGGLSISGGDLLALNTQGSVTLRTVGDLTVPSSFAFTADGNVVFEANGGTFTAGSGVEVNAPRYLVYADTFNQGGLPDPDETGFADFDDDPIATGNVFYEPAAGAEPPEDDTPPDTTPPEDDTPPDTTPPEDDTPPDTTPTDTTTDSTADSSMTETTTDTTADNGTMDTDDTPADEDPFGTGRTQDQETTTGLIETTPTKVDVEFGFTPTKVDVDLTKISTAGLMTINDNIVSGDVVIHVPQQPEVTVVSTTISGIAAIEHLGLNIPAGSEAFVDEAISIAMEKWLEDHPGLLPVHFNLHLQEKSPQVVAAVVDTMAALIKAWSALPEEALPAGAKPFIQEFKQYVLQQRQALAKAARAEYAKIQAKQHDLSGMFRNQFPDVVALAQETMHAGKEENGDLLSFVLATSGLVAEAPGWVAVQKALAKAKFAKVGDKVVVDTTEAVGKKTGGKLATKISGKVVGRLVGTVAGAAAGPVGLAIEVLSLGIDGALNMQEDVKHEDAYNAVLARANEPVDLATMDTVEMVTHMTVMMAGE